MKKECMITNFLLENCSMGTVFDYDDETHIRIIGKALKNTPKELLSYLLDASESWRRCKNRNLAERLQDIFEIVYQENQPFATKEECINDIEKFLNSEDIDYIDMTIYTLKTINNEYSLGIDERVNNLIKEEKWKEEYKIRQKQNEIAEEIKNELLKKAETEHQRNVIKETINGIKRKHRFDYLKK